MTVDVSKAEQPQEKLLTAIAKAEIIDAVVRLNYKIRPEQTDEVFEKDTFATTASTDDDNGFALFKGE